MVSPARGKETGSAKKKKIGNPIYLPMRSKGCRKRVGEKQSKAARLPIGSNRASVWGHANTGRLYLHGRTIYKEPTI
jgi:hypothetical protein